jgi:NAD-dependent dihydropyrimidine dehydrogenase PreA subunit
MAVRQIVRIDEDLCDGCGDCVPSCAEGAIKIVDGKAKLLAENLCDGLGACLGHCHLGAIIVEEREADEYDEEVVHEHLKAIGRDDSGIAPARVTPIQEHRGCPGSRMIDFSQGETAPSAAPSAPGPSALRQWPVQLHLLPPNAPYFKDSDLLLAADCSAFTLGDFHSRHLQGKTLAIACPKLDQGMEIYLHKIKGMIDQGGVKTITVMVMEVPCCTGLTQLVMQAADRAERKVPVKQIMVGVRGDILGEQWL